MEFINKKIGIVAKIICVFLLVISLSACGESDKSVGETSNGLAVDGDTTDISVEEISTDSNAFVDKLVSFGFTEKEAKENAEILLTCGIPTIENCEPTSSSATIDGLVAFRGKLDDDRVVWFTVEDRKIFYVALNGEDLYDEDQGGYLKNFNDVHIPKTSIKSKTKNQLRDMTETLLDKYFGTDVRYYDAWAVSREDDNYGVQCQVSDGILDDNWIYAYVWYEKQDDGEFKAVAVKIDGVQYEVKD